MTILDKSEKIVNKIIIYGDVDGVVSETDKVCDMNDIIEIKSWLDKRGNYTDLKIGEDCFKIAADVNFDGKIGLKDNNEIVRTAYFVNNLWTQNHMAKNPDDIIFDEAYIIDNKLGYEDLKMLFGSDLVEYEYNKSIPCYIAKLKKNTWIIEDVNSVWDNATVYSNGEKKEENLKSSGYIENDDILYIGNVLCIKFKIEPNV